MNPLKKFSLLLFEKMERISFFHFEKKEFSKSSQILSSFVSKIRDSRGTEWVRNFETQSQSLNSFSFHSPALDKFDWHLQASVHFTQSSAVNKSLQHQNIQEKLFLGTPGIEPEATGWDARMLPLCYAAPYPISQLFICSQLVLVV